jgi:Ca2+-binding EF-hand superfamily protein
LQKKKKEPVFDSDGEEMRLISVDDKEEKVEGKHIPTQEVENELKKDIFMKLTTYKGQTKFKKEVMNVYVKMMQEVEIEEAREEFRKIDLDHNGMISENSLAWAFKKIG